MLKKGLYILCLSSILSASSTMCFKKNHLDLSTIETTMLNGGKCDGKRSVSDMKKDGFIVDDIKISNGTEGLDYIYIFKKDSSSKQAQNPANMTRAQMKAQLKEILNEDEVAKKVKKAKVDKELGKKLYTKVCAECHGKNGEISVYNVSTPLNTLSVEEIKVALREYDIGDQDKGFAMIMRPYAKRFIENEVHGIATYIQTLK